MLNILTITLVTAVLALVTTNPGGEITAQILLSMAGMLLAQLAFFDMAFLVSALTQDARAALGISVLGVVLAYGFAVTVEYIGSIDILGPISPFRYCARLRCPRGTNRRDAGHGRPHRRARHHPSGIETMERARPPRPRNSRTIPHRRRDGRTWGVPERVLDAQLRHGHGRQAAGARRISGITILGSPTRVSHDSYWPLVCLRQVRKVAVNAMPVAAKPSVASNERPSTMDSTPRASAITPEMAETNALVLARPVSFTLSSQVAVSTAGSRRNPIARRPSRGWIWPEVLARHCCGTTLTKLTIPVKMTW